jgi:hypothetical protein
MIVRVSFDYYPDEPEDVATGMSEEEYERLIGELLALGADNIEIDKGA